MSTTRPLSRRNFLKLTATAAGAAALPTIIPGSVWGAPVAPGDRITIGMIGTGGHGVDMNLRSFLHQDDARIVAVCDVDEPRCHGAQKMVHAKYGNTDCTAHRDFREILARPDIDAVMISTPDHWHVPISLMAMRAGKDVICEKPTLTLAEGRVLADTVRRSGRVYQTSTEDRSVAVYHRIAELVRNGRIGKLQRIEIGLPTGSQGLPPAQQKPQPVPPGFDFDLWLGPAPLAPYSPARCHFHFRWISDYSGGMLLDWGAHLLDTAQWANDTERTGPIEVEGKGEYPTEGIYDTATNFDLHYTYANGVTMNVRSGGVLIRCLGTEGWLAVDGWRGPLTASSRALLTTQIGPGEIHLETCPGGEHRNFLDCVKTRRDPYFPAEIGHRCCSVMHIGNIAMWLGRKLRWNPDAEEFVNDDTANRLRSRIMREPWTL